MSPIRETPSTIFNLKKNTGKMSKFITPVTLKKKLHKIFLHIVSFQKTLAFPSGGGGRPLRALADASVKNASFLTCSLNLKLNTHAYVAKYSFIFNNTEYYAQIT